MDQLINKILSQPRTYLPLLAVGATWISDTVFPALGLPVLSPEAKQTLTVLLFALAFYFLRSGAIKTKDLSIIMTVMTEYLTKEIKQGSDTERQKSFEEQLKTITDDDAKTKLILELIQKSKQPASVQLENDLKTTTEKVLAEIKK